MATTRLVASRYLPAHAGICSRCLHPGLRWSSTSVEAPTSPLLAKIKNDLKAAMRAKDTARLAVLRGTISEINQAASSSTPVKTDMHVLALLRKRKAATENARKDAEAAQRPDLAEKQTKEMEIVDELIGTVKMVEGDALKDIVTKTISTLKDAAPQQTLNQGLVMKELLKTGGELDGKPYNGKTLAEMVKEELTKS